MKILFINSCVRSQSRTRRLADALLSRLDGDIEEVVLSEISFPVVDGAFIEERDRLIAAQDYSNPMFELARQFAAADIIVIAAPYWDLSFPAALKQYIEQINVLGITFVYGPDGIPKGLCKASKIYYVMTAGGYFAPEDFGYGYVKALAENYYGIRDTEMIKAVGLDIVGADEEAIMRESIDGITDIL